MSDASIKIETVKSALIVNASRKKRGETVCWAFPANMELERLMKGHGWTTFERPTGRNSQYVYMVPPADNVPKRGKDPVIFVPLPTEQCVDQIAWALHRRRTALNQKIAPFVIDYRPDGYTGRRNSQFTMTGYRGLWEAVYVWEQGTDILKFKRDWGRA